MIIETKSQEYERYILGMENGIKELMEELKHASPKRAKQINASINEMRMLQVEYDMRIMEMKKSRRSDSKI